jgi:glyoxylate reductase
MILINVVLQRNMELLVLENIESAVKKGVLITQVSEQSSSGSVKL